MFKYIQSIIRRITPKKKFIPKIHTSFQDGNHVYKAKYIDIGDLYNFINFCKPSVSDVIADNVIVSLTSHPKRLEKIFATLASIVFQTIRPSKIVLVLEDEKQQTKIKFLDFFKKYNLTICRGDEFKSYNKLIPVMIKNPESILITADDDIFYEENWLQSLLESYADDNNAVHSHRTRRVYIENNEVSSYKKWKINFKKDSSFLNFQTGVGGVLYPPHSLYRDFFRKDLYSKIAPYGDDIWFWAMCVLKGTPIRNIGTGDNLIFTDPLNEFRCYDTLGSINNKQHFNDIQIKNILRFYPQLYTLILK